MHYIAADHANSNDDANAQHEEGGMEAKRSWGLEPGQAPRRIVHANG